MSRNSLIMSMLAMGMCMGSSYPYYLGVKASTGNPADHSKNIRPYHSKPIRKGAMQKKLTKKQRKQLKS